MHLNMKLYSSFTFKFILISLILISISSCKKEIILEEEIFQELGSAPSINLSPEDFTIDLVNENNSCSKIVTLEYNVSADCPRGPNMTATLDAPGLISQTPIDEDGNISFEVEFCALDELVNLTFTLTDACANVVTHELEVHVIGENCVSLTCQKFIFSLDEQGSREIYSNDFDVVDNFCDHMNVSISFSQNDILDTVNSYNCQTIIDNFYNPNITDSLFFWINDEVFDYCRIIVFFSDDPNSDGDTTDGWKNICGL